MYTQKIQITHTKRDSSTITKSACKISNSSDTDNEKTVKTTKTTHHKCATKLDKHAQTKNLWHMKNTSDVARLSLRNNQAYVDN